MNNEEILKLANSNLSWIGEPNNAYLINRDELIAFATAITQERDAEKDSLINMQDIRIAELEQALQALFEDYKQLADSGDAGNWTLEETKVGKQALEALTKSKKETT